MHPSAAAAASAAAIASANIAASSPASMWRMSMRDARLARHVAVTTPGQQLGAPDGRHAVVGVADVGDREREAGRGAEAVAAHRHRHRPGVRRPDRGRSGVRARCPSCRSPCRCPSPRSSRIGPCSMCTSTYALTFAIRVRAAVEVLDVDAVLGQHRRAARRRRGRSGRRSTSMSSVPTTAAEPNRLRLKRAPSSSAQSTRATVTGGVAVGGEGAQQLEAGHHAERAVEPTALRHAVEVDADDEHVVGRSPRRTAQRLPASSVSTSTGSARSSSRSRDRASSHSGVHARRRDPSGPPRARGQLAQIRHHAGRRRTPRSSPWSNGTPRGDVPPPSVGCRIGRGSFDWTVTVTTGGGVREDEDMPKYLLLIIEAEQPYADGGRGRASTR